MSFKFVKQLPSPEEIKEMSPVTEEMKKVKETRDRLIQDVITGNSDKFLVIVGPCSADNEEACLLYTSKYKNDELKSVIHKDGNSCFTIS